MRMNFGVGLVVGVLFASALVVATGGYQGPSLFAQGSATGGLVFYTAATATTTVTSTTTSAAGTGSTVSSVTVPTISSNATSGNSASNALSSLHSALSPVNGQAPSSLAALVNRPSQSLLLLLPVALALILGFAVYKSSASED